MLTAQVDVANGELAEQFGLLKQLSRELIALVRLSAILPRSPTVTLSPVVARRLEVYVARKDVVEAGALADFMANVVECSHEEKLRVLAAVDPKERVERVVALLQRHITSIQSNTRITIAAADVPGGSLDIGQLRRLQQEVLARRGGKPGAAWPAATRTSRSWTS